jgi:hypothetical protein
LENGDAVLDAHYLLNLYGGFAKLGVFGHIIFSFIVGNLLPHLAKLVKLCLHRLSIMIFPHKSMFLCLESKMLWMRILYVALFTCRLMLGVMVWNFCLCKM